MKRFTKLAVVSRFKKDAIKLKKKGGSSKSKVDPRVVFSTTKGQFAKKEKVVVQVRILTDVIHLYCVPLTL